MVRWWCEALESEQLRLTGLFCALVLLAILPLSIDMMASAAWPGADQPALVSSVTSEAVMKAAIAGANGKLPLSFIPNDGQVDQGRRR